MLAVFFLSFFGREQNRDRELEALGSQPLAGPLCGCDHLGDPISIWGDGVEKPGCPAQRQGYHWHQGSTATLCGQISEPGHRQGLRTFLDFPIQPHQEWQGHLAIV